MAKSSGASTPNSRDKGNRPPMSKRHRVMVAVVVFFWISAAAYFVQLLIQ